MRKIILVLLLALMSSKMLAQSNNRIRTATYNYQTGNFHVNTITYNVSVSMDNIFVKNVSNILNTTPRSHPELECAEVHLSKPEWTRVENVFRQVFPIARRRAFVSTKEATLYEIYANEAGQIQEVSFYFQRGNPITPQEIYQLEVGLKALTVQYNFPPANISCAGVIYRNISTSINISEL